LSNEEKGWQPVRPTAAEMLGCIEFSLDADIVPNLNDDPRAHSTVKSIRFLLRHLAVRIGREPEMVHQDCAEIRDTCAAAVEILRGGGQAAWADSVEADVAAVPALPHGEFASLDRLYAVQVPLRRALDDLLKRLARQRPGLDAAMVERLEGVIDAYLGEQIAREEACLDRSFTELPF
jgi:hypothetical protein